MSEDITQDPEYIEGYEARLAWEREKEENKNTPRKKGWMDAAQEIEHKKVLAIEESLAIEKDLEARLSPTGFGLQETEASQLRNEVKQIKKAIEGLDERLKKLEKYTQE